LSSYTYIRGTLQVLFLITAPGASYGRYCVTAMPQNIAIGSNDFAVSPDIRFANIMQTDHYGQIDIATSNSVILKLPWVAPMDVAPITGNNNPRSMWDVAVSCLLPVATAVGSGVTVANVQVYANLTDDYVLTVPSFQSKDKASHTDKGKSSGSHVMSQIADVMDVASNLPVIGSFAKAGGVAAHAAASVLSFFGFTREAGQKPPTPFVGRTFGNIANVDGVDISDIAGLSMDNGISIDPTLSGFAPEDCLSNVDFFQRWTLIDSYPWGTDTPPGTILLNIPVTPSLTRAVAGSGIVTAHMMTAGFYGLPFAYWRGDMEYRLVIPVSKLHRGAIQVLWCPLGSSADGQDVTNLSFNKIFDVSDPRDHDFSIGYCREDPFLSNEVVTQDISMIVNVSSVNGFLTVKVINPLMAQTETAGTRVFLFGRAGANMKFAQPRDNVRFVDSSLIPAPAVYEFYNQVSLQGNEGGTLGDGETMAPVMDVLVPTSGDYPSADILFGEDIQSLRALLQKPSLIGKLHGSSYTTGLYGIPFTRYYPTPGAPAASYSGRQPPWTWAGHYRSPFLGLSASERYKLVANQPCFMGAGPISYVGSPQYLASQTTNSTLWPLTYSEPTRGAEFTIPNYHRRKFRSGYATPTVNISTGVINDFEAVRVVVNGPEITISGVGLSPDFMAYYSFGPDIRGTCFRQLPAVVFNGSSFGNLNWFDVI